MVFKIKEKKILNIIKYHMLDNLKFVLCFGLVLFCAVAAIFIVVTNKQDNLLKHSIAFTWPSDEGMGENRGQAVPVSRFCNFFVFSSPFMIIPISISIFFITRIFFNEFSNGNISFWLVNCSRNKVILSKWLAIQIMAIIIFMPEVLFVSFISFQAYDTWNVKWVFAQGFSFLYTIIFINTLFIFLGLIFSRNIYWFSIFTLIIIFWLMLTGITSEVYYDDKHREYSQKEFEIFKYNKWFSLEILMPLFLNPTNQIDIEIPINNGLLKQNISKLLINDSAEVILKLFCLQPILNIFFIILSFWYFKKKQFANL
ncbi:hypothetical protein [Spiroplasma endosymbiont of Crioceris asparagi]|uniref:hypothetical protein n=1 Tax=Spiroplasma endosymbiont of Crioceris asparagi TaxID=3066286 RepID=UPI0030CF0B46